MKGVFSFYTNYILSESGGINFFMALSKSLSYHKKQQNFQRTPLLEVC